MDKIKQYRQFMRSKTAYDQILTDRLIGVDGVDEFVVYLSPVGKI